MSAGTVERVTHDAPALEPDDSKRASVKAWRREVADWLRAHGIAASGPAWELATVGERDLTTLRRAAASDPAGLVRHWTGHVMPDALTDGDMTDYGQVIGEPMRDPETGTVWITTRRVKSGATDHDVVELVATVTDHELAPGEPVRVSRGKGERS